MSNELPILVPLSNIVPEHIKECKLVKKEELHSTRWLRFVNLHYTVAGEEKPRQWQSIERTTTKPLPDGKAGIDAVIVFTTIKKTGEEPKLVIIKQFRPPCNCYCVELVAGLIDPGETPEVAALRELKEETGYVGKITSSSGRSFMSPGLTGENIVSVFIDVDGDDPLNEKPIQAEEDSGMITKELVPLRGLYDQLKKLEGEGYGIWVGLWTYAIALNQLSHA
jgi:8-oxo-dGTP pyrophosphatase MutT (NUDIX family)